MAKSTGRSTDTVGVEAEPRERRFMRSALAILGETGRTDSVSYTHLTLPTNREV